jgi:hypothetical protein
VAVEHEHEKPQEADDHADVPPAPPLPAPDTKPEWLEEEGHPGEGPYITGE